MKLPAKVFAISLAAIFIALNFFSTLIAPSLAQDKKMTSDEVVSRHLDALGSREARAAVKSRVALGSLRYVVRTGNTYSEDTVARVMSLGSKFRFTIRWPRSLRERKEEEIIFDGESVANGFLQYQKGFALSDFIYKYPLPIQEGLLGGALSTSWPLARMEQQQPRLEYKGLKKALGRDAHALSYRKRKGLSDLKITLYFDAATFRHIRTEYLFELDNTLGADAPDSSRTLGTRQLLTEEFDDFREVDGLTLPQKYKLQLTRETGNRSSIVDWELSVQKLSHKEPVEDGLFKAN